MDDLYQDLGVPKTATAEEIKKAYREAAFKYHPDRNPGDAAAEEKFKKINAAYSVLGDENKRAQYDRYGSSPQRPTYQSTTQNPYDYDPFEEMFRAWQEESWNENRNAQSQNQRRYTYTYYGNNQRKPPLSKRAAVSQMISSILSIVLGFVSLRFVFFFFPISLIIIISLFARGISGLAHSLQCLFGLEQDK